MIVRNSKYLDWTEKMFSYTALERDLLKRIYPSLNFNVKTSTELDLSVLGGGGFNLLRDSYTEENIKFPLVSLDFVDTHSMVVQCLSNLLQSLDFEVQNSFSIDERIKKLKVQIFSTHPWFNVIFDEIRFYYGELIISGFYVANVPDLEVGTIITKDVAKKLGLI